jgi:hypothetical protein
LINGHQSTICIKVFQRANRKTSGEKEPPAVDENSTVSLKNFKYDKRQAEKNIPRPMD